MSDIWYGYELCQGAASNGFIRLIKHMHYFIWAKVFVALSTSR
jgi:hypothetical protein